MHVSAFKGRHFVAKDPSKLSNTTNTNIILEPMNIREY